jgi:hypothetical protein
MDNEKHRLAAWCLVEAAKHPDEFKTKDELVAIAASYGTNIGVTPEMLAEVIDMPLSKVLGVEQQQQKSVIAIPSAQPRRIRF